MFGNTLQDHERDSLIACCHRWSDHFSDDEVNALSSAILDVFVRWRLRQADTHGRVRLFNDGTGLLGLPMPETRVPQGDVEPWQCAGPFVHNDIDLAFKLWLDDDPDFAALLAVHQWVKVFSLIGLWAARTARPDSLIRLNGFLVKVLVAEVNEYARLARSFHGEISANRRRANTNLAKARDVACHERSRKGDELRQSLRKAAFDYLLAQPLANSDNDLIPFLRRYGFEKLSASTIKRLIAGVRREVKQRFNSEHGPRTDLYATGQKSRSQLLDRPQK